MRGALFLLPSPLSENYECSINKKTKDVVENCEFFIAEDPKIARSFIKKFATKKPLQELKIEVLNEHTKDNDLKSLLVPISQGYHMCLMSDAGCPGIADPGAKLVALAHEQEIKVVPLVGPSSILLALMASGLNGQRFSFEGYLSPKTEVRRKRILELELESRKENETKIFIETPYRNNSLMKDLLDICNKNSLLTVASSITGEDEYIMTKKICDWNTDELTLDNRPTIFLLHSSF